MTATERDIEVALEALRAGELVGLPTETVYGLGADASNPAAIRKVFAAKGRPSSHPLIVHLARAAEVPKWAREYPPAARTLAERFWPGPLTLVLPRAAAVPLEVTGGQDTVALRVPSHPVAQRLLEAFGGGIAAPSANRYGRLSPTRAEHVREELGSRVAIVLDGGECEVGLESTIVACLDGRVSLLRPGRITRGELEAVVGPVGMTGEDAPRVPGSTRSHYAPSAPLELVDPAELAERAAAAGGRVAVLARGAAPAGADVVRWIAAGRDPGAFAHELYARLRELDALAPARILVERVPAGEAWAAVRDRLERAASGREPEDSP